MSVEQTTVAAGDYARIVENENVSVDVGILYDVAGNDKNFIYRTINTFLKKMPDTLNKIQQGINNLDWDNVSTSAHSAKSSLSVIKVGEMLDWIIQLEDNAKSKANLDSVPGLVKKIKEKYFFAEEILNRQFKAKNDNL